MLKRALRKIVAVRDVEVGAMLWSAALMFFLFSAYYILRPIRDEIGATDRENLSALWTGTFAATLIGIPFYAAVVGRNPRRVFLPRLYRFFIVNLVVFYGLLQVVPDASRIWIERVFYVWISVFPMFVGTSFWSYMADLFSNRQGKRMFGFIAAGGTLGGVAGSGLVIGLVADLGAVSLVLISMLLLEAAARCVGVLDRLFRLRPEITDAPPAEAAARARAAEEPVGGTVRSGLAAVARSPYLLGICLYLFLFTWCSTVLYFEQSFIVGAAFEDRAQRTEFLGTINLATNGITVLLQLFATGRLIRWLGVGALLMLLPLLNSAGFLGLAAVPTTGMLFAFLVVRRAGNFALARPAREVLFTVVGREQKYKSKGFIDTVVYRGGDVASGWIFQGLEKAGMALGAIAGVAAAVGVAWATVGRALGRRQEERAAAQLAAAEA